MTRSGICPNRYKIGPNNADTLDDCFSLLIVPPSELYGIPRFDSKYADWNTLRLLYIWGSIVAEVPMMDL